jgi:aspartate ammonia-lyase
VGTGFGTFPGYVDAVYEALRTSTGIAFNPECNFFDGLQNADVWISISSAFKALALTLNKLCSDLRLMSSGPRAGLAEIELPSVQPGSSIMPGKVNPVIPEMVMQVYFRVLGNDLSVTRACEGELELNVWESLILNCISESATLLIRADARRCERDARSSLALSTVIATLFDYESASSVARQAVTENRTIEEVVVERGLMTADEARRFLDPAMLISADRFNAIFDRKRTKP